MRTLVAVVAGITACSASAHHGSTGQFDLTQEIEVSGVVSDIRFVNPHSYVYFDVTNESGSTDPWRCELRSGSLLKRSGWSTEMFKTGSKISITGAPARREEFGCMVEAITFPNGKVVERYDVLETESPENLLTEPEIETALASGVPNLNGNWVAPPRNRGGTRPGPESGPPGVEGAGGPPGMGGPPQMGAGGPPDAEAGGRPPGPPPGGRPGSRFTQTEAGIAASTGFVREDNPRFHCEATNLFLDWTFDEHVNQVEQTNDRIVMTFGFMDIVRTIHLNMDSHPSEITPSRAGHSIGKWDGDTLIVDTIGFEEGYLDATFSGTKHSDQMHVVEQFSLSEDGTTLKRSYTVNDPFYLAAPFEGEDSVTRTTASFDPYECEDLTEEIVEGF